MWTEEGSSYEEEDAIKKTSKRKKIDFDKGRILWFFIREASLLISMYVLWYLSLIPINLHSILFVVMVLTILGFTGMNVIYSFAKEEYYDDNMDKSCKFGFIYLGVTFIGLVIAIVLSFPLFGASDFQKRLTVENVEFEDIIKEVSWNQIPMIDKDSSRLIGNREMGTIVDKISQYDVSDDYTLINYKGTPVRVSPLDYAGMIKWFTNKSDGIPGYMYVDTNKKEAKYVDFDKAINYSKNSLFSKNIKRHIRNLYPDKIFDEINFELDDNGNPYFVIPTQTRNMFSCEKHEGTIIVNPIDGSSEFYKLEDVPEWIDRAVDTSVVIEQIDSWGKYKNGFWNSIFGQKDVSVSTEGYNYITIGNDVYLYTGITSAASDESNIGFMLVNMRTGKAKYIAMSSSEEYSAMASAEGQVQHLGYTSTFPILMNIQNHPTYFLSLKDGAGLIKMYGLVDATDYQKVVTVNTDVTLEELESKYLKIIGDSKKVDTSNSKEISIKIEGIVSAQLDGNTIYYFSSNNKVYVANIEISKYKLPLIKTGDTLNLTVSEINSDTFEITKIKED